MIGDPYEEAENDQRLDDARLVPPRTARKNSKGLTVIAVGICIFLGIAIVAGIASSVTSRASDGRDVPKPKTMTKGQSDSFAQQQDGQAQFLKGMDRDKTTRAQEDTILGYGKGLASETIQQADGIPRKAQDDPLRGPANGSGPKSEGQMAQERLELEALHRRQNDLNSSPVALDFSDYFAKEKEVALMARVMDHETPETAFDTQLALPVAGARSVPRRRSAIAEALAGEEDGKQLEEPATSKTQTHNPSQDYVFDSSFGKLYRLMEDTVLETVLVNRLSGASVGPVVTMLTTDVYSSSGSHLLIPKGTRLLGSVTAVASLNQERLFVAFHRMIMPDGYSVSLDKFKGLDVVGQTGLRDLVNHHYTQIFGSSLALAAVAATAQIGNNSSFGTYDWGVQMRAGMSQEMGQSAQRMMERFINILPTFTIRERSRVKIMLSNDLLLPDIKNHTMDPDL